MFSAWPLQVKIMNPSEVTSSRNMSLAGDSMDLQNPNQSALVHWLFLPSSVQLSSSLGQQNHIHNTRYLNLSLGFLFCCENWHSVKVDSTMPVYCTRRPFPFLPSAELGCSHYMNPSPLLPLIKSPCFTCSLSLPLIRAPRVFLAADVGSVHSSVISRQPFSNTAF